MRIDLPGNLNEIESASSDIKIMEPGWYLCSIDNVEVRTNKDKQGKHLLFSLRVIEEGEFEGNPLWDRAGLNEDGLPFLKARLEAAGAEWDEEGFDTEYIIGNEVEVRVANGVYNDQPTNEVKAWRKP